jgi:hypothetical protein
MIKNEEEEKEIKILAIEYEEKDEDVNPINLNTGTGDNSGAAKNQQNTVNSKAMNTVIFQFEGRKIHIQCTEEDSVFLICLKFCTKIEQDIKNLTFLYDGNTLNLEKKFSEVANQLDKERKEMNVVVDKKNA